MLDLRKDTIIYQSQVYYSDLVNTLVSKKKLGKANDAKWKKAAKIRQLLKALKYFDLLVNQEDIDNTNYTLNCLIQLCELNTFPVVSPLNYDSAPNILFGIPGSKGDKGDKGDNGATGLATDFQAVMVGVPTSVDTFLVSDANGARWDYIVLKSTGESRAGSVLAIWDDAGTLTQFQDISTDDIVGSTSQLEFSVQFSSGGVLLVAIMSGGVWSIKGSRYFIPNNGNGTGPISGVLPNGYVYIGNSSNLAQAQLLSGAIVTDNLGVTTLQPSTVFDANISTSAAISISKLAPLTASKLVVTDSSGILSTSSSPTLTEVGFLSGVLSAVQPQINSKLSDPMTSTGDVIIRNAINVTSRLAAGSSGQVLTIAAGVPTWQNPSAGFADPMTSIGDIIRRNSSNVTSRLSIGSTGQVLTVIGGLPAWATPSTSGTISGLTTGRIPIAASSTSLTDNSNLTFSGGTTINVPVISTTTVTNGVSSLLLAGNPGIAVAFGGPASARLHIAASSGSAGTTPLKFNPGTLVSTPENGSIEYNGVHFYGSVSGVRHQLDQQISGLTSGRVTLSTSATTIGDDSGLLYNTGTGLLTIASKVQVGSNPNISIDNFSIRLSGGPIFNIVGGTGGVSVNNGSGISLDGGLAYQSSGNGDGGPVFIMGGQPHGSGNYGSVYLISQGTASPSADYELAITPYIAGGGLKLSRTISAIPGAITINKISGVAIIPSGSSGVVVTNSLVNTDSIVIATVKDTSTAVLQSVITSSGSFVIRLNTTNPSDTRVGFIVIN